MPVTSSTKAPRRRARSGSQGNSIRTSLQSRLLQWLAQRLGRTVHLQGQGWATRLVVKKLDAPTEEPQFPGMVTLKPVSSARQADMRKELRELLRRHPQTKSLLRHLAYVERTLRQDGVAAVDALPLEVLVKALSQLESLVRNWSVSGLDEVRSRLSLLVKNKQIIALHRVEGAEATEMDASQRAEVGEVSHSVFEEMDRSWRGEMPPALIAAMKASNTGQ